MNYEETRLDQVWRLNVNRSAVGRAPHKPLLLLVTIDKCFEANGSCRSVNSEVFEGTTLVIVRRITLKGRAASAGEMTPRKGKPASRDRYRYQHLTR
jgi:hypothetical protein